MKTKFAHFFMTCVSVLLLSTAFAQTTENFNSRPGISLTQVKSYLQERCWTFSAFEINGSNGTHGMDGDGVLVSKKALQSIVYSPLLDVPGNITISFDYKLKTADAGRNSSWVKLFLSDRENNMEYALDSFNLKGMAAEAVHTYHKEFTNIGSGMYKVYIKYTGLNASSQIAIDEINFSSPQYYSGGCNAAPFAADDIVAGMVSRSAKGYICANDYDPDQESLTPYLIKGSSDGNITINTDRSFSFHPNADFNGGSTIFTYRVCDEGEGFLCSNDARVIINFPSAAILPRSLVEFTGNYKEHGKVQLNWAIDAETISNQFEIQRSFDGINWKTKGVVGQGSNSPMKTTYEYIDNVTRKTTNSKELYYRLKVADHNGEISFSRILVVRVYNTKSVRMISVTPNPLQNDIAVNLQLYEPSYIVSKLLNNNGLEMNRKSIKAKKGTHSLLMEGSANLLPGLYMLEVIINSKERMMIKLIRE